jgi:hypothetical protein
MESENSYFGWGGEKRSADAVPALNVVHTETPPEETDRRHREKPVVADYSPGNM